MAEWLKAWHLKCYEGLIHPSVGSNPTLSVTALAAYKNYLCAIGVKPLNNRRVYSLVVKQWTFNPLTKVRYLVRP